MITTEKTISLPETYPLSRLGDIEKILFFDIETTGLSAVNSNLYLIGCTYCRDNIWHLIQWFNDDGECEEEILSSFFSLLEYYTTVVHFNGDGFDIPYLTKRCEILGLPFDFSHVESIDIYKRIKPYKKLLRLENLKQKSIERFLNVYREDKYSGGDLIKVYFLYLVTKQDELYDMLMLHNMEDLEGMPYILPILNYPDFLEGRFSLVSSHIESKSPEPILAMTFKSDCAIPVPFSASSSPYAISCRDSEMELMITLFDGTLKHFYPDYKNYYYLIYEDMAVHKSIGEFVDRSARKKATAQDCYTKKTGLFLPDPNKKDDENPLFKKEYNDKTSYIEYDENFFKNEDVSGRYIRAVLKQIMHKSP